eukprot:256201_1
MRTSLANMRNVEHALGNTHAAPLEMLSSHNSRKRQTVQFYFDLLCPWSYLAITQLSSLRECAEVEIIPIDLQQLLQKIGSPLDFLGSLSEAKRTYFFKDLQDY